VYSSKIDDERDIGLNPSPPTPTMDNQTTSTASHSISTRMLLVVEGENSTI
jgi:hypothetical protein